MGVGWGLVGVRVGTGGSSHFDDLWVSENIQ